jgi:catechol 2,3-dioxygenase-like lactoylglutathione lyase family enzyme
MPCDETVNVRYMVDDVATAVDFYTGHFGYTVRSKVPAFADVTRGNQDPVGNLVELFQPAAH